MQNGSQSMCVLYTEWHSIHRFASITTYSKIFIFYVKCMRLKWGIMCTILSVFVEMQSRIPNNNSNQSEDLLFDCVDSISSYIHVRKYNWIKTFATALHYRYGCTALQKASSWTIANGWRDGFKRPFTIIYILFGFVWCGRSIVKLAGVIWIHIVCVCVRERKKSSMRLKLIWLCLRCIEYFRCFAGMDAFEMSDLMVCLWHVKYTVFV